MASNNNTNFFILEVYLGSSLSTFVCFEIILSRKAKHTGIKVSREGFNLGVESLGSIIVVLTSHSERQDGVSNGR